MSAKPPKVPLWGTDGYNSVEPSADKKALGWVRGEKPSSSTFQWLQRLTGDWLQYLSDGALDGAVSVSGLLTASDGLTLGSGKHLTLVGTGQLVHGDRIRAISPLAFSTDATWVASFGPAALGTVESTAAGRIAIPIPLTVGERIKSVTIARKGNGAASLTSIVVMRLPATGTALDITAAATSDASPAAAWADKVVDVTDTACADGDSFYLELNANAAGILLGSIRATFDRPAP